MNKVPRIPEWLDKTAASYWHKTIPTIIDAISNQNIELFATHCQWYSDYRNAPDLRHKKLAYDFYLKSAKQCGIVIKPTEKSEQTSELDAMFGGQ